MIREKLVSAIENRLWKNKNKKLDQRLRVIHKFNHKLVHLDEFVVVILIWWLSLMFASFFTGLDETHDSSLIGKIDASLQSAITNLDPYASPNKIISKREVGCNVENGFYCGYCAYGAAIISPEFFPYLTPTEQIRSRWWNAWEWCQNALDAGYMIWDEPQLWSLIIYRPSKRYSSYWHVGKVIFTKEDHNWIVVRDMNYTQRYEMTDRRQDTSDPDIDCYIYPKVSTESMIVNKIEPAIAIPTPELEIIEEIIEEVENWSELENWIPVNNLSTESISWTESQIPIILNFEKIDEQTKIFLANNTIEAELISNNGNIKIWQQAKLRFYIKNKNDWRGFSGILPIAINLISTNWNVSIDFSSIKFVSWGTFDVNINWQNIWDSSLIINLWLQKVWLVSVHITQ